MNSQGNNKSLNELTLVIPDKADLERDSVAKVWEDNGGNVFRIGKFWAPPEMDPEKVKLYGNDTFCLVLAQKIGLELVEPADDILAKISDKFLKRNVRLMTLGEALKSTFPRFMKSASPKIFQASVYESAAELEHECRGLVDSTLILVSDIVEVKAEARCFVLNQKVLDCSLYEGSQSVDLALEFAKKVTAEIELPITCVMDVGYFKGLGWGIVEFNASWGAGLNGCNAQKVFPAIMTATNAKIIF